MPTQQMMVMLLGGAAAIERLAVLGPHDVDRAGRGHGPELVIDGGQPDPVAAATQLGVDVLGAAERVGLGKRGGQCPLLPRCPFAELLRLCGTPILCRRRPPTRTRFGGVQCYSLDSTDGR
jgi:hypothetical protein